MVVDLNTWEHMVLTDGICIYDPTNYTSTVQLRGSRMTIYQHP